MKHTLLMIALTAFGAVGCFWKPLYGVYIYYLFAVLRPQYIWQWAIPARVPWSQYVAVPTVIAVLMSRAVAPQPGRTYGLTHVTALAFFGWVTLTYFTAFDKTVAWGTYQVYLKQFVMFFVAALVLRTVRDLWILLVIGATTLAYIAYEVNSMYLQSSYMGIYFNGYGGLDNNGAGLMLAMGLPLCLFVHLETQSRWRWAFAAFIPPLLHAVLMTFSRGAMVAMILASPLVFVRRRHKRSLTLAVIAVAIMVPFLAGQEIRDEFFSVESYEEDNSAQSRFDSWRAGYLIALDNPIVGVGVRNSPLFSHQYGADMEKRAIHNNFIQILADSGFPALGLYLLLIAQIFRGLRKVRRLSRGRYDNEDWRRAYGIACAVEASLGIFFAGSLFLSLEVFELPWLLMLIAMQLPLAVEHLPQATMAHAPVPGASAWYAEGSLASDAHVASSSLRSA